VSAGVRMPMPADPHGRGLQFPGTFEVCAMGAADAGLAVRVPAALSAAGLRLHPERQRSRPSAKGNWVSVTCAFDAATRADYELAHATLRALPGVKWTL